MKTLRVTAASLAVALLWMVSPSAAEQPSDAALERTRETVKMLDNIFKQTIVLVTDKYVEDEDDFAAGSAAVLLFKNVSESGPNKVRLIDATGDPYESENVAKDDFEKAGLKQLKAGKASYEQVVTTDGEARLRVLTAVPVVHKKCIMCHDHYADVPAGQPIGALSYIVPIK
ncbi:c-type heme family protein [Roseimaritima ulvae]|uniref:Tll0287-like domain-containing protein n=1 Tax=Roseimaritima ulvae TaxID=980254 RepID=A0A5B9QXN3_9BACT|nr:DUF3365 domain-containing protein [Roseimaritima ulvae]QEG42570.1 hypothetical protein UC8_46100 [Roseimaritima ulvae]